MRLLTNDELAQVAGAWGPFETYITDVINNQLEALWSGVQASGYQGNLGSYIQAGTVPAGANQTLQSTLQTFYGTFTYKWINSGESYMVAGVNAWVYLGEMIDDMQTDPVNVPYDIFLVSTAMTAEFQNMSTTEGNSGYHTHTYNPTATFNNNNIKYAQSHGYYPPGSSTTATIWENLYGYNPF